MKNSALGNMESHTNVSSVVWDKRLTNLINLLGSDNLSFAFTAVRGVKT